MPTAVAVIFFNKFFSFLLNFFYFQSLKDAVALLANDTEVAVIGDSARLALIAAHDCQLEVIVPTVEIEKMNSTSQEIGVDFSVDFAVGFHHMNAAFSPI